MSARPPPPVGSECLDVYEEGARVYYYRSGTQISCTIAVESFANLQEYYRQMAPCADPKH